MTFLIVISRTGEAFVVPARLCHLRELGLQRNALSLNFAADQHDDVDVEPVPPRRVAPDTGSYVADNLSRSGAVIDHALDRLPRRL